MGSLFLGGVRLEPFAGSRSSNLRALACIGLVGVVFALNASRPRLEGRSVAGSASGTGT